MNDFHVEVTPERIANAVNATQSICALPAIATQDWCDKAADTLALIVPGSLVAGAVCTLDAEGAIHNIEAVGAGGANVTDETLDALRNRFAAARTLGWSLGAPGGWRGPQAARIEDLPVGFVWSTSHGGRVWSGLGVNDVIVAAAPIGSGAPERVIVVEIGAPSDAALTVSDVALVRSLMRPLAARTRLAFGDEPINASRVLTPREQEILSLLALGKSVREIAEDLSRSPHTVHDHVKALHRKLRASSRGALIARAFGHPGADREKHVRVETARTFRANPGAAMIG